MYRQEQAHRFEVCAHSVLQDAALRNRVEAQRASSSAARQPGRSETRIVAFEDRMNAAGKRVGIELYDGASHDSKVRPTKVVIGQRPLPTRGLTRFSS